MRMRTSLGSTIQMRTGALRCWQTGLVVCLTLNSVSLHGADKGGENVPSAPIKVDDGNPGIFFQKSGGGPSAGSEDQSRAPIPNATDQRLALKVIEQTFKTFFAQEQTPQGREALIRELLEKGALTEDDLTGRYVMLDLARSKAVDAGDVDQALAAVDELADSHRIPRLEHKRRVLKEIQSQIRSSDQFRRLAIHSLNATQSAIRTDDFLSAASFIDLAKVGAERGRDRQLANLVQQRMQEFHDLQMEFGPVQLARRTLQQNPKDPGASLKTGQYYALTIGDWGRGLPLLVQTNDNTFRQLARLELKAPTSAADQLALADGWWNWGSQSNHKLQRFHAYEHAASWYQKALPLLKGLNQARVTRRLQDFAALPELQTYAEEEVTEKQVFLADLPEQQVHVIRNAFSKDGRNKKGETIHLKGRTYAKGLWMPPHPKGTAEVSYDISQSPAAYFRTNVGVDDRVGSRLRTPLVFEVWGDQTRLWRSAPVTRSGQVQACRIPIKTVTRLELKVLCSGTDEYAWPLWGNPRLTSR